MIDIVIIDTGKDIEKTLFSILIQTLKENVHVYIVENKKNKIIPFFKKRLNIQEIIVEKCCFSKMRKYGYDKGNGDFVIYLNSGDVFYDVFSLANLYRIVENHDVVIGSIMNMTNRYSNHYFEGNLYRRSYLNRHRLAFLFQNNGSYEFHRLVLMSGTDFYYCNDYIYCRNWNEEWYSLQLGIYQDTIMAIDMAKRRKYQIKKIATMLYDVILYYSYLYRDNRNHENMDLLLTKIETLYDYYQEYQYVIDDDLRKYVSELNLTDAQLDYYLVNDFLQTYH